MPIARFQMPDGRIARFEVPEGTTPEQAQRMIEQSVAQQGIPAQKAPERPGFFGSFKESMETLGLADEAAVYAANPSEENRKKFLEAAKSKYESVGGFGKGENWEAFKELLGSSLGQMVAPIGAATAGSIATPFAGAAAGASTIASQYGIQNLLRQAQEQEQAISQGRAPEELSLGKAALATAGETALDVVQFNKFKNLYKAFPMVRNLVGGGEEASLAAKAIVDSAKEGTLKTTKQGIVSGAVKGVAFEVPQEVAQQALERWQAGLSLTDDDAKEEFKQAAIGALALGPVLGGAEGYVETRAARREAEEKEAVKAFEEAQKKAADEKAEADRVAAEKQDAARAKAFDDAKVYADKLASGEVQFSTTKGRVLVRKMGYDIAKDSSPEDTRAMFNDILSGKEIPKAGAAQAEGGVDISALTSGQFAPAVTPTPPIPAAPTPATVQPVAAAPEVPSGTITAPVGEAVDTTVGRGVGVPPSGVGAGEPSVAGPQGAGVGPVVSPPQAPNVGEGAVQPALKATPKIESELVGAKEPGKDAISRVASIMAQNAPSETEGVDYAADKLDPLGVQKEEIKAKPGVNARRLAKMLGPQLYGDPSNMGSVSIKEILQNSFDSIKGMIDSGKLERGKIDVEVNPETRTIDMLDNGAGMSPQLLGTKFLEIAGTGKDAKTPSGGFGIAKMLFLYGNKGIRVVTMQNGRVSEMVTNGDNLFDALDDPEAAPDISVRNPTREDNRMFPDGHGVFISLQIPEDYEDPQTNERRKIDFPNSASGIPGLVNSPLFSNIDVSFNNKSRSWGGAYPLDIGSKFPYDKFGEFANVKFPWGTARIYVADSPDTRYGDNLHVLSNGLYQFSQRVRKNPADMWSGPVPYQFYVDIKPTVKADDAGYPFTFNRQDFTERAKKDYTKVLSYINAVYAYQNLSNEAKSFGTIQYFDSPTSVTSPIEIKPTVPPQQTAFAGIQRGDKVTVEDGKLFVRGKELPELTPDQLKSGIHSSDQLLVDPAMIDPTRIMLHDNVQFKSSGQDFSSYMREQFGPAYDAFIHEVGDVFQKLREEVARILDYPDLNKEAIGLSIDTGYRGVSIRIPFSGSFVDPFAAESPDAVEGALGTYGTMIHELAHHKVRRHDKDFPAEMQKIIYKLRAAQYKGEGAFYSLEHRLTSAFQNNQEVFKEGWRVINEGLRDGSIEPRGNRFEDASREDVRATEGERIPESERGPSREGRAGQPVQPAPVSGTGQAQAGRPAQPATGAAGPKDNRGRTPEQAIKARQDKYKERFNKKTLSGRILKYLSGKDAGGRLLDKYESLVKKFQNDLRPALKREMDLRRGKKLISFGPGMNNAFSLIASAQDKAAWIVSNRLKIPMDVAYKAIENYAKSRNLTTDQAIEELDRFRIVMHEPERRMIMFMRYVPLSTKRRAFTTSDGKTIQISPAEIRDSILKSLVKKNNDLTSNGQAEKLHNLLKGLVSDKANLDPLGDSPIKKEGKPMSTDINDEQYSVLAGYSPDFIKQWGATYNALGKDKAAADAAIKAIEDIQDITKDLNRQAKYWSQTVDNIVAFYNFKHYTPFKGVPGTKVRAEAEMTDPNDVRISGEFANAEQAMEGRESEADNSILQSLSDALFAASRAGRAGVTEAVKNLIEQGHVSGKKIATITQQQRWLDKDFDFKKYKGSNKLFHYTDDGDIEVYKINKEDMPFLESIRRPYQVDNWTTKMANNITGFMGQMHTRFNPAFAPLNFPRDIFTNTMAFASDVGGKEAMSYLSDALFRNVMKGGLHKSANLSKLMAEGKTAEIRKLAATNPFYADALELFEKGGRTAYQQAYSLQAQADAIEKMLGPNGVVKAGKAGMEAIGKWADMYGDAFEFTNRVSAYGIMKNSVLARLQNEFKKKNGRAPNAKELQDMTEAAKVEGAAFAKNLANFRLIGSAGRQAGGLFMFFRASATGAARAIDSLLPALVDEKTALSRAPESIRKDPEAAQAYLKDYRENKRRAQWTIFSVAAAGAFLYSLALAGADDDDQGRNKVATDDMARWTRYARLPILGKETVLQIPWGFGLSSFGALGAQVAALAHGNQSAKDMAANTINIAFDSFIPLPKSNINIFDNFTGFLVDSVTPTMLRPWVEYAMNTDNLGSEIYNSRQTKMSDAFTGGTNVPDLYKDVAKSLLDYTGLDISPNSLYFWATNYVDALSRIATSTYDLRLFASGQKEFRSVDDLDKVLVPFDSFIGTKSNYDGRQFEAASNKILEKQKVLKGLEQRPEAQKEYLDKHPTDPELVDYYNYAVNGDLKYLRENANQIRLSQELSPQQKRDLLKENTRMQNLVKRNLIDSFKMYGVSPD